MSTPSIYRMTTWKGCAGTPNAQIGANRQDETRLGITDDNHHPQPLASLATEDDTGQSWESQLHAQDPSDDIGIIGWSKWALTPGHAGTQGFRDHDWSIPGHV